MLNKVIDSQVSATNTDHNCLAFNLHENSFTVVPINAYGLSLEVHLASQLERFRVDEVCQSLVNRVFAHRLVYKEVVFHFFLEAIDQPMEAVDLIIFDSYVL